MASIPYPAPSATFRNDVYNNSVQGVTHRLITFGLLSGLYGVLTVLSVLSMCTLIQRVKTSATAIVLSLTILVLLTSTTIYVVTSFLNYQTIELTGLVTSAQDFWSYSTTVTFPAQPPTHVKNYTQLYTCATSAALTTNVTLADAIVCWRACVVWHRTRAVKTLCGVFLLGTFVLGALDTAECCADGQPLAGSPSAGPGDDGESPPPGPRVLSLGLAACVLSLATNLLATLLVGYKAWRMRRRFRGFLLAKVQVGGSRSRTWKVLSLLVESGAVYCATWVLLVAFQADTYRSQLISGPPNASPNPADGFQGVFRLFVDGCLVPLIAIYPTIIIVLVAFDKSHIENALAVQTHHLRLAVAVDSDCMPSSGRDSCSRSPRAQSRGTQVQVIDRDRFDCDSGRDDDVEGARRRVNEERKAEAIV